jgi:glucan phosphoethanolaminetransferase (alkaline phosphatase superfamily)
MQTADTGTYKRLVRKSIGCAILAVVFFVSCFIRVPLGNFFVWVSIGATAYFVFLTIYFMVMASKAKYPFAKKKLTKQEVETREYIRSQLPILISILLGGVLIAVVVWFFLA